MPNLSAVNYLSTFTWIGWFEHGILRAYPNAECVGFSEINKFAVAIYLKSFPNHKPLGDITAIDANGLPDFQLLCGGSPCQSHSALGDNKGFEDPRGQLFFDYIRLLKMKKPKAFVFENVNGLKTADKWARLKVVLESFIEAGYKPTFRSLKASDYGVPHDRNRLFIVGIRNDIYEAGFRYKWPEKIPLTRKFRDLLDKPKDWNPELFWGTNAIDAMDKQVSKEWGKYRERRDMKLHQDADQDCARTIVAGVSRGYPNDLIEDWSLCKDGRRNCEFAGVDAYEGRELGAEGGFCHDCEGGDCFQETVVGCPATRQMSSHELARLFGFPEDVADDVFLDGKEVHLHQKKHWFGNSVVVDVISAVMGGFGDLFD